jgi:hypothetical protein
MHSLSSALSAPSTSSASEVIMLWLIPLGLAVTYVAVKVFSEEKPSSSLPGGLYLNIKPMTKLSLKTGDEPYADPWVSQEHGPYAYISGREYLLAVPRNGAARASALLARVVQLQSGAVVGIDALKATGARIAAASYANEAKTRDQVTSYVKLVAAAAGPIGVAFGQAYDYFITRFSLDGGAVARARTISNDAAELLQKSVERMMVDGLPYPIHTVNLANNVSDPESLAHLASVAQCHAARIAALPKEDHTELRGWWGLLLSELSKGSRTLDGFTVDQVMRAMGGHLWGAENFASDEQIVLVAVAYAAAFKLSLRTLVTEMWEKDGGWSRSPERLQAPRPSSDGTPISCTYRPSSDAGTGSGGLPNSPMNATQVQLVRLVRTARSIIGV